MSKGRFLALLALHAMALAALGAVAAHTWRAERDRASRAAAAAESAGRAGALEEAGRFGAARWGYERAAGLSPDPVAALAWQDAAARVRALAALSAAAAPDRAAADGLRALADTLEVAADEDSRRVAAALRVALHRADANASAGLASARDAADAGLGSVWLEWQRGLALVEQLRYADAITALEPVVRARPALGPAWHRLGLAYAAEGRAEAAIEALQRAIERGAPPEAAYDLARTFLQREMWAEAIPHLDAFLQVRVDDPEVLRLLAAAQYGLKRYRPSAETYQRAWRLRPEPRTLLSAAIALQAGGAHTEALDLLDRLLPDAANIPEVRFARARTLLDLGRPAEGHDELRRYIQLAGERPGERERVALARRHLEPAAP